jgi:hypothetical protein
LSCEAHLLAPQGKVSDVDLVLACKKPRNNSRSDQCAVVMAIIFANDGLLHSHKKKALLITENVTVIGGNDCSQKNYLR